MNGERDEYEKQILVSQWDQIEIELSDIDFGDSLPKMILIIILQRLTFCSILLPEIMMFTIKTSYILSIFSSAGLTDILTCLERKKWEEIYLQYQRLRDWYKDRSIYHKLGYLVSIDYPHNALLKVFKYAHPDHPGRTFRTTDRVRNILDLLVRKSLQFPKDKNFANVKTFADLSYNIAEDPDTALNTAHHDMIKRYLTLYNIMVTESASQTMRYSFACHNTVDGGWSLEHIHAQKSQTLNKTWQWIKWIANHRNSLVRLKNTLIDKATIVAIDQLIVEMDGFKEGDQRDKFNAIADKYRILMDSLTGAKDLYQDAMTNMALLGKHDNSTLSNSTFDVKRHKIMRRLGTNFVPIATERVFLKAISGETKDNIQYQCDTEHMFYWGADDRAAYLHDIKRKNSPPYLKIKKMEKQSKDIGRLLSFHNMLDDQQEVIHKVLIPKIQRDYAQGRNGMEALRQRFLKSIFEVIDNRTDKELMLDFVFGQKEESTKKYVLSGRRPATTDHPFPYTFVCR